MKIVFFGSDDFAAVHLNRLLASSHCVAGCITQPDKPQGRGMHIAISPIKEIALARDIPCLQPAALKDPLVVNRLKEFKADVFVVVAYGKLLSAEVLFIPKVFCVNVHGSLLPKYRGAAPINWAILNGDAATGVSVQKMDLGLDAGDMIAQASMSIAPDMNSVGLKAAMARRGADLLVETLNAIEQGKHTLTPQNHAQATLAPKLTKDMGRIVWSNSAEKIYNQVRGLQPWPGAYTFHGPTLRQAQGTAGSPQVRNKMVKILKAACASSTGKVEPGQVMVVDKAGIHVACGQGTLIIKEVHPEAGNVMSAAGFAAGYKIAPGMKF